MFKEQNLSKAEEFVWITAFVLSSLRATIFWDLFVQAFHLASLPWIEIGLWVVLAALAFRSLQKDEKITEFRLLWKRNWFLAAFIAVALVSISWSVAPWVTLYRSLALLFSSLLGAYIGFRYSVRGLLDILYKFGAFLLIVCFSFAVFLPVAGAMFWEPYNGAWRGVFWHKNHLGSIAALFNFIFLLSALEKLDSRKWQAFALDAVLYLFSLVIVYFSKSAAGLILVIILDFSAILAYAWTKLHTCIKPIHYYAMLALGAVAAITTLLNLDAVFGLFNRSPTMTGRVPMWNYLVREVIGRNPWFGYGFGAIWTFDSFRVGTQKLFNWGYPIVIADNGFLDILLHVGYLGFIPFLGVLAVTAFHSFRLATSQRSLPDFLPLLFVIFAVFSNISFSLFLETETFIWLIVVAVLFGTMRTFFAGEARPATS